MSAGFLKNTLSGLTQLFYPENCEGCNDWLVAGESVLCLHCREALPYTGFHLIPENPCLQKFTGRLPLLSAGAFLYFTKEGIAQHLMHRFKYRNRKKIGKTLGAMYARELSAEKALEGISAIVPVPLHPKKLRLRGFDQNKLIAAGISEVSGIPVFTDVLTRVRHTPSQTMKTRKERLENVQDAFKLAQPEKITGRHILLLDDVITTGATLESAGLELLQSKEVQLSIYTLGIAAE